MHVFSSREEVPRDGMSSPEAMHWADIIYATRGEWPGEVCPSIS